MGLARRRHGEPRTRPGRAGPLDADQAPRQLWLAVLRHAGHAVRGLRLRHRNLGRAVQLQRADERLALQHGPEAASGVAQPDVWYSYDTSPLFPELGRRALPGGIAPMGGRRMTRTRQQVGLPLPELLQGHTALYEWSRDYMKEFRLSSAAGWPRSGRLRSLVDNPTTWSTARTARSTCSSTVTATSPRTRTPQLAKINFVRGNHTPLVKAAATPTAGRHR